jgi:N-acetylglucosamine-6-phosphate deacetylase
VTQAHRIFPGFLDLQCNGRDALDLTVQPERLWELGAMLPPSGVTAFLPTLISPSPEIVERAIAALGRRPSAWRGAEPLGWHLEGPMINARRAGAHPVERVIGASADAARPWRADRGITLVTLAPELAGALEVTAQLRSQGVVVSLGHSEASSADIDAAINAGASAVTHLFNAMAPLHHRAPGLVGAALADPRLTVGLVADGVHVDPRVVALAARVVGAGRLLLVTDGVGHTVGGRVVAQVGDAARLADGSLAGSTLDLDQAMRNLSSWTGWTLEDVIATVTSVPARLLGLSGRGSLAIGARADVVELDADHRVGATWVGGEKLYEREGRQLHATIA